MTDYWYPTAFSLWGDEEQSAIDRVRASGRYTMGPEVAAFEREFADAHGKKYGVMVNSGSSANLVATAALAELGYFRRGEKVLVPALAWSTTYAPLIQYGLDPVLLDCDDTWNVPAEPDDRWPTTTDVSLIVSVPILGNPAHQRGFDNLSTSAGITLMQDNCESLGAVDEHETLCGTHGHVNTFSFFHSHQISAIEGGMILTDDQDLADTAKMLRAHGWSRDIEFMGTRAFEDEYDFRVFGYNVRPVEMHAAIAREQLKKLPHFVVGRRDNTDLFRTLTADLPIVHPNYPDGSRPSPFGLAFEVGSLQMRTKLAAALRAASIDCRLPTGGSFHLHRYGKDYLAQQTPRADRIHYTGMFIGNPPVFDEERITRAATVIRGALQS